MRRRRRAPAGRLEVAADPILRAGTPTRVAVDVEGSGDLRVSLRLLGWDMRAPQKWRLAERAVEAGRHSFEALVPAGLPPGCARMTEYSVFAELVGRRVAAATPVALVSDHVFVLDGPASEGTAITLDADAVEIGGTVSGRAEGDSVEIGAELHTLVGTAAPRFQPVATLTPAPDGSFTATLPTDIPPTLSDGEELAIVWTVRAGSSWRRFAVTDPAGHASERRPPLLTYLAQLSRDPFALP